MSKGRPNKGLDSVLKSINLNGAQTRQQLMESTSIAKTTVERAVNQLYMNEKLSIVGWIKGNGWSAPYMAVFGLYCGQDAIHPKAHTEPKQKKMHHSAAEGARNRTAIYDLIDGKRTAREICDLIGMTDRHVARHLKRMRDDGEVHISDWKRRSIKNNFAAVYEVGAGENVPYPKKPSNRKKRIRNKRMEVMRSLKGNPWGSLMAQIGI